MDLVTTNINLHPGLHSCSVEQDVNASHWFIPVQLLNMLIFTQKGCRRGSDGSSTVRKSHTRRKEDLIKLWQMSGSDRQMWQMCRGGGHHSLSLSLSDPLESYCNPQDALRVCGSVLSLVAMQEHIWWPAAFFCFINLTFECSVCSNILGRGRAPHHNGLPTAFAALFTCRYIALVTMATIAQCIQCLVTSTSVGWRNRLLF